MTGRNIDPAYSGLVLCSHTDGTEKIVFFGGQQHIVGQRTGCYDTYDVAFYDALCGFGVFDLLTNGDLVAGLQHLFQIAINSVIRHAGQRDGIGSFAPAGQRQAQNLRACFGIFVERLVEIAHAKKQYGVRVLLFELMKLLHSRC